MEITKATTMGEMLQYDMGIAYVLMEAYPNGIIN